MPLTPAQQTALATDIQANTNTTFLNGVSTQIKNVPHTSDGADAVAQWYNQQAAGPFYAYYGNVPVHTIIGSIRWKRLTPVDAPTTSNGATFLACQGIQFNIQLLLGYQSTIDATQSQVVQGFADALSAVPSGTGGATQDAGWTSEGTGDVTIPTMPQVLSRTSTNAEKLFANTTAWGQGGSGASQTPGSTGPATLTFQGNLADADISSLALWGT